MSISRYASFLNADRKTVSKWWFALGAGSLIGAGFLSLFIMLGRIPAFDGILFGDALMRRILVVHVNLALPVFLYAFLQGLYVLIPSRNGTGRLLPYAFLCSLVGVILLVSSFFYYAADPVMSNYLPVIDHPVFGSGLSLFVLGIVISMANERLRPYTQKIDRTPSGVLPVTAIPILQWAAYLFLLSILVFLMTAISLDGSLPHNTYYELLLWGGGHILQFVNMALGVAAWNILFRDITGEEYLTVRGSFMLFSIYSIPVLFSPFLLINGATDALYITGFKRYMQWGIFPVITICIAMLIRKLWKTVRAKNVISRLWRDPVFSGLVCSIALTLVGFIIGGLIRGGNTMVPAHYHAMLGAIALALMAVSYMMSDYFGRPLTAVREKKRAAFQLLLFGVGQLIFVSGLAVAGYYGLPRKVFGDLPITMSTGVYFGLGLLGLGGLLAVSGGVLYFWILGRIWLTGQSSDR